MKIPDLSNQSSVKKSVSMMALVIVMALLIVAGLYCMLILSLVLSGTTNHVPAKYTYTVTIQDLNNCTSDGSVEVLVPIPYVNGQQVFTDDELNETCGEWCCAVKMTEAGKMISITSHNRTLYNFGVSYSKLANNVIQVNSSKEVRFSAYSETTDQDAGIFERELAQYGSITRHLPVNGNWINYSDKDSWMLGNTTVTINGKIWKPEMRKSIVVDMQFEARGPVPDGAQPLIYAVYSCSEVNQTNNSTYTPAVLSYGPFQYPRSPIH